MTRYLIVSCHWADVDGDSAREALDAVKETFELLKAEGTDGYALAAPEDDSWAQDVYAKMRDRHNA